MLEILKACRSTYHAAGLKSCLASLGRARDSSPYSGSTHTLGLTDLQNKGGEKTGSAARRPACVGPAPAQQT